MQGIKIAVFASGSGSNLQALIDQQANFKGEISLVFSNRRQALALERAKKHGINTYYQNIKDYVDAQAYDQALLEKMKAEEIDLIVLAGYLRILSPDFIKAYPHAIINVHPSLLPAFSGDGFYGKKVHEAVLARGCKVSGASVHFVDEGTDTGPIIFQKTVDVDEDETAESLAKKVLAIEHELLPKAVQAYSLGQIKIENGKVSIGE